MMATKTQINSFMQIIDVLHDIKMILLPLLTGFKCSMYKLSSVMSHDITIIQHNTQNKFMNTNKVLYLSLCHRTVSCFRRVVVS